MNVLIGQYLTYWPMKTRFTLLVKGYTLDNSYIYLLTRINSKRKLLRKWRGGKYTVNFLKLCTWYDCWVLTIIRDIYKLIYINWYVSAVMIDHRGVISDRDSQSTIISVFKNMIDLNLF